MLGQLRFPRGRPLPPTSPDPATATACCRVPAADRPGRQAGRSGSRHAPARQRSRRVECACRALPVPQQLWGYQDAAAFLASGLGGLAVVKLFDRLAAAGLLDKARALVACPGRSWPGTGPERGWLLQRLSRKLVHIVAGPGFAVCWLLFRSVSAPSSRRSRAACHRRHELPAVSARGAGSWPAWCPA